MKRILSILLSMSLIATLLISMSVASFAVNWSEQPGTWIPSDEFGDMTLSVTEITEDATKNQICMDFIDAGYEDVSACFAGEIYFYDIKVELTNLATHTTKKGLAWYGSWFMGTSINFEFDPATLAYSDETGYIAMKYGEDSGSLKFSTQPNYQGKVLFSRAEDKAQSALVDLPPMNGTAEAHTVGDGASDYTYEIVIVTNTKTFDFQIAELCYSVCELSSEQTKNPKNFAPSDLDQASCTKRQHSFPFTVYSVVDGELSSGEVEPEIYKVKFMANGEELSSEDLEVGAAITVPTEAAIAAAPEGKTFSHWAETAGGTAVEPAATMPAENLEYHAVYKTKTFTVTFNVNGVKTTKTVAYGETPTDTDVDTEVEGKTFTGWLPELGPITTDTIYTAQFDDVVEPPVTGDAVTMGTPEYIDGTNGDILPGKVDAVVTNPFDKEVTVKLEETLRVHTTFNYNSAYGTLAEMGMLFVPKAVADKADASTVEAIIAAKIAKDANCNVISRITTGSDTNITFKAGLLGIPANGDEIEIYAIPYYRLSNEENRTYQNMKLISFK